MSSTCKKIYLRWTNFRFRYLDLRKAKNESDLRYRYASRNIVLIAATADVYQDAPVAKTDYQSHTGHLLQGLVAVSPRFLAEFWGQVKDSPFRLELVRWWCLEWVLGARVLQVVVLP